MRDRCFAHARGSSIFYPFQMQPLPPTRGTYFSLLPLDLRKELTRYTHRCEGKVELWDPQLGSNVVGIEFTVTTRPVRIGATFLVDARLLVQNGSVEEYIRAVLSARPRDSVGTDWLLLYDGTTLDRIDDDPSVMVLTKDELTVYLPLCKELIDALLWIEEQGRSA
jgi:hypothetical protein